MSIETVIAAQLAVSTVKLLIDFVGPKANDIATRLIETSSRMPPIVGDGQSLRVQDPDRRISWGVAKRNGKYVVVILAEREDSSALAAGEEIRKSNPGIVETRVIGRAHSVNPLGPPRKPVAGPLYPGASIGHVRGFPGSIGCVVKSIKNGETWIGVTSASHVLSINNTAHLGDTIIAPGHPDGPKSSAARCGSLSRFIYLTHYTKAESGVNVLCCPDIALVAVDEECQPKVPDATWVIDPSKPLSRRPELMAIKGWLSLEQAKERSGDAVYKVGRSTDLTKGRLDIVGLQRQSIQLPDGRLYLYTDVLTVEREGDGPFSEPGDSGSLVYTTDGYGVGFIIGGTSDMSFVSPIEACLNDIEASMLID